MNITTLLYTKGTLAPHSSKTLGIIPSKRACFECTSLGMLPTRVIVKRESCMLTEGHGGLLILSFLLRAANLSPNELLLTQDNRIRDCI